MSENTTPNPESNTTPDKTPDQTPILLRETGHDWMSFTKWLIPEKVQEALPGPWIVVFNKKGRSSRYKMGKWEMAATAAAIFGPENIPAAKELAGTYAATSDDKKASFLRLLNAVWTGVGYDGMKMSAEKLSANHVKVREFWDKWRLTQEGIDAMAARAAGGGDAVEDIFAEELKSAKARSAGSWASRVKQDLASTQQQLSKAEAEAERLRALLKKRLDKAAQQ